MLFNAIRDLLLFSVMASMIFRGAILTGDREQTDLLTDVTGPLFFQPVDPEGRLLLSSKLDPDGSDRDKYVWENFTLDTTTPITRIDWIGGYDPTIMGNGGPVIDFRVSIYPSIPAGTEPAVAYPPLVQYFTGGNAGQTSHAMVGAIQMYSYTYTLPEPFTASASEKYWVQIQAFQQGLTPDWGIASATGGEGSHYLREGGAGGDIRYHSAPGDAAFTLLGSFPDMPTDIILSNTMVDENQPANTIIGALTAFHTNPDATFTFRLTCESPGVDDPSFNINGTKLRTSAPFDYEIKTLLQVCIRVKDQNGVTLDKYFTINVNNIDEFLTAYYMPAVFR